MRTTAVLLALMTLACDVAQAQFDARVRRGARIRVTTADARIEGRVSEVSDDSILVDQEGRWTAFSLRDATGLAVHGRGPGAEALSIGLGIAGAAVGAGLYIKWCSNERESCAELEHDDEDCEEDDSCSNVFGFLTVGFGMLGAALGYALAPPRWHDVPLPVRVGVAPVRNGFALILSMPAPRFARNAR